MSRPVSKIRFWAWTVSLAVHVIALTIFAVVRFAHARPTDPSVKVPTAQVRRIRKLLTSSLVTPKPKVKPLAESSKQYIVKNQPAESLFDLKNVFSEESFESLAALNSQKADVSAIAPAVSHPSVEFFGSSFAERKICYVVDCSGSMTGTFAKIRSKLTQSISALEADQYFYIIFFGGNRLYESGNGKLVRATSRNKSLAFDFIDSMTPAGSTEAAAAMKRALQISGPNAEAPDIIYLLTDGFELESEDDRDFSKVTSDLLADLAAQTRINTIGFWPRQKDRQMLEEIAKQSDGEFIFITDLDN